MELGGHVFDFRHIDKMREARMSWAKRQIRWDGSAPASIVQSTIDFAHTQGFKIMLSIVGEPSQLGANPTQYYASYASFVAGVAALNPDAIEIWNEPNIDREWPRGQVSGANYTQLLSAAYTAIKAVNPNILVISGAPAPTGFFGGQCAAEGCDDDIFIRQMAQSSAASYMDCVGMHYNEGLVPPSRTSGDPRGSSNHYSRYFQTMVNLYSSVFPGKNLCFTEIGYLSPEGFGPLPPGFEWAASMNNQKQADYIVEAATIARRSNLIRLFIIWNIDATRYDSDPMAGWAIVRPDGDCKACAPLGVVMQMQ